MIEIAGIGILTAFFAGVISFLSPCVLPMVPGYLSYVSGESLEEMEKQKNMRDRLAIVLLSLYFVLGFTAVFVVFGATASALGQLLLAYRYELNIVSGIVIILFGMFLTGLLRFGWLQRDFRMHGNPEKSFNGRPLAAFVLGLAFAFGWTPCIGPVLGSILMLSASTLTVGGGITLLFVYSLGLGIPFIALALFTNRFLKQVGRLQRHTRKLQIGAGVLMIIMGIAVITGYLSDFAWWMFRTFPIFAKIG